MDKITIKGISAYGRHGVFQAERDLGQPFIVDVDFCLALENAGQSDDLNDSVSYAAIYELVIAEVSDQSYALIEKLCRQIITAILQYDSRIQEVLVTVKKPQAPLFGHFEYASVTMQRSRAALTEPVVQDAQNSAKKG